MPKKAEIMDSTNGSEMTNTDPEMVWLSEKQATEYLGFKRLSAIKHLLRDGKIPAESVRTREVHPDFPALTEITIQALNDWREAQRKPERGAKVGRRNRKAGEPRKIIVWVLDADYDRFVAHNTEAGFRVAGPAYAPRGKKAQQAMPSAAESAPAEPNLETQSANAELFTADLVEA